MPRRPRVHITGGFYHVTLRGNHRQPIFDCDRDRDVLDGIVTEAIKRLGMQIHAYCWMTNHLHLLVEVGDAPLGRFMQRLATRYARYYQRSLATTGHLFERRYHAVLVAGDEQLLAAVRYVHLNPVRAGLTPDAAGYRWSGHRNYLGLGGPAWLYTGFVLDLLGANPQKARSAYADFVNGPSPSGMSSEVAGCPGLEQPAHSSSRVGPPLSASARQLLPRETLDQLVARICAQEGVTESDLRSRSRARRFADVRARIALECRVAGVATLSELARRFDRHVASLSKGVTRRQGE